MAAADQPAGLMDIASAIPQDEIPFKLRCAVCNQLALNAFRLPCCDQATCENCQASLPETCPVCAHTPLSSDLCKPNKALRTTLKAFLRTEEKKREKDRQQATPTASTPAEPTPVQQDTPPETPVDSHVGEKPDGQPPSDPLPVQPSIEEPQEPADAVPNGDQHLSETVPPKEQPENDAPKTDDADATNETSNEDKMPDETGQLEMGQFPGQGQMPPNPTGMNMGGFPNMPYGNNFNPMAQFMNNDMFNFQNPMGMPGMAMDPMTQGMFGGFGMNMNGINDGMNMGMTGQAMYGGWDGSSGSQQNNMWNGNGGPDKFNPNAFANGMGSAPQYGGPTQPPGYGGYNMSGSYQYPNQSYQNGDYYGPGYSRGKFWGRGRGFYPRGGRGGFTGQPHANANPAASQSTGETETVNSETQDGPDFSTAEQNKADGESAPDSAQATNEAAGVNANGDITTDEFPGQSQPGNLPSDAIAEQSQFQGIPTVDCFNQPNPMISMGSTGMPGQMGPGQRYGRGGYMRGGSAGGRGGFGGPYMGQSNIPAPGPGVEGAPAAPRAMRQGLPNTSVLRQRGYQQEQTQAAGSNVQGDEGQAAPPTEPEQRESRSKSVSKARSRSRSRDESQSHRRRRSSSYGTVEEDRDRRRHRHRRSRREERYDNLSADEDHRTRSASPESSRRSSRRRDRDRDRGRDYDRDRERRHRTRRHRPRSPSRNGDSRDVDQLPTVPEEYDQSEVPESSSRSHRSRKERSSRYESDRERERDRDRDRDRDSRRRHREREKDRDRDRGRDRDRHHRSRDNDRDRADRKRTRRDRSESAAGNGGGTGDSDYTGHRSSRRPKHDPEPPPSAPVPEKDPHTLEREARNRERMQKEQQRREMQMQTPAQGDYRIKGRRDSRQGGGLRRFSYKYEDEEARRAARVEMEREGGRWD